MRDGVICGGSVRHHALLYQRVEREGEGRMKAFLRKLHRRAVSDRGSVFLEYCLLSSAVFLVAVVSFSPGSNAFRAIGADFAFRSLLMRLPIF